MEDKELPESEAMADSLPVDNTSHSDTARVLASFILYSLAMFTFPFIAFVGTRYTLRNKFHVDGFANTVWSVLAAVIVTNVIIMMYVCKGYNESEAEERKEVARKTDLNQKKEE